MKMKIYVDLHLDICDDDFQGFYDGVTVALSVYFRGTTLTDSSCTDTAYIQTH